MLSAITPNFFGFVRNHAMIHFSALCPVAQPCIHFGQRRMKLGDRGVRSGRDHFELSYEWAKHPLRDLVNSLSPVKDAQVTTKPDKIFEKNIKVINVQDKSGDILYLVSSEINGRRTFELKAIDPSTPSIIFSSEDKRLFYSFNGNTFNYSTPKLPHSRNVHADDALSAEVFATLNTLFEAVK